MMRVLVARVAAYTVRGTAMRGIAMRGTAVLDDVLGPRTPRVDRPLSRALGALRRSAAAAASLRGPAATVLLFWWIATAAIFLLERTASTRALGVVIATALAVQGLWWVFASADDETPAGARRAFLGASLLWTWVQVAFYSGWLVGPEAMRRAMPAQDRSLAFAWTAISAMSAYQAAMLAVVAVTVASSARRKNRVAAAAIALFWIEHQVASINIFLGVRNPGRGFFPEQLAFLESYFGPPRTTIALPLSIAAMTVGAMAIFGRLREAREARDPRRREAWALLLVLALLGVFELVVLGMPEGDGPFAWVTTMRGA